jgi:hypothetical protein
MICTPSDLLNNLQDTETLASFSPNPHWAVACLVGIRFIRFSSGSCPPFENQSRFSSNGCPSFENQSRFLSSGCPPFKNQSQFPSDSCPPFENWYQLSSSSCPPFENWKDARVGSRIRPRSYRLQPSLPALAGLQSAAYPRGPAARSESLKLRSQITLTLSLLLGSKPDNLKTVSRPLGTAPSSVLLPRTFPSVLLPMVVLVQEHQTTPSKSFKHRYLNVSELPTGRSSAP